MNKFIAGLIVGLLIGGSFYLLNDSKQDLKYTQLECAPKEMNSQVKIVTQQCDESVEEINTEKIEKAFLLFLASIGIKKDYAESVKTIVDDPESFKPEQPLEETADQLVQGETQFYYPRNEALKKFDLQQGFQELIEYEPSFRKNETLILRDPIVYFAKSKIISGIKKLKKYNGQYIGKLYRLSGKDKGKVDNVEISIEYWEKSKDKVDGKFTSILTSDGIVYSESNGNGENNDLYLNPQNPRELILRVKPEMYFHFIDRSLKNANVYDKGEFIGVSTLKKL